MRQGCEQASMSDLLRTVVTFSTAKKVFAEAIPGIVVTTATGIVVTAFTP